MQDQQQQTQCRGLQGSTWLPAPDSDANTVATAGCTATAHIALDHSDGQQIKVAHLLIIAIEQSAALCEVLSDSFLPISSLTRSLNASIASSKAAGTMYQSSSPLHVPVACLQHVCRPDPRIDLPSALGYLRAATRALTERQIMVTALTAIALTAEGVGYDLGDAADQNAALVDGVDLIGCLASFHELPAFFIDDVDRDFYAASTLISSLAVLAPRHIFSYVNTGCDDGASVSTHLIEIEEVALCLVVSMGPYSDDGTDASCLVTVCFGDQTERASFFHRQINLQINDLGDMFAQAASQLEPEHIRECLSRLASHPTLARAFQAE